MNLSDHGDRRSAGANGPQDPRRRRFLRRALIGGAVVAAGWAGIEVSGRLRRRELTVALPNLPPRFRGFRIGLVSDTHRGAVVSEEHCRHAASLLEGASCDLIVNLGDNVTGSARYAPSALAAFRDLRPPAGKLAVLGNHDYWTDASRVKQALTDAGFRTLVNERINIERAAEELHLAGIDDLWAGHPDFEAALRGVPDGACVIVLSHNPDAIYNKRVRRADLVLAGHTHGGQVLGANRLIANCEYGRAHPHGLYREGGSQIYVTSGVGVISPPIRLGVRPEVAALTLRLAP